MAGPDVRIRSLDLDSDAELEQYGALGAACDEAAYGASEVQTPEQLRASMLDTPFTRRRRWVAVMETIEGGESIVGRAALNLMLQENQGTAIVGLAVHPALRGQGIGTELARQALEPAVRESGRAQVLGFGDIPADGDIDDPDLPVARLARRYGLERRTVGVARALDLPVDPALLDALETEAAARLGAYSLLAWGDEVPTEHLEAYGALLTQLELDDPDEDLEFEAAEYPPERIRELERERRESGMRCLAVVAVAPDGSFVGNTEIHVHDGERTTLGWQENTLVMPGHRGHRLGLAMKVANHRRLAERFGDLRTLVTYNSHVNPWMISINEKLGYRVVLREIAYQGPVRD